MRKWRPYLTPENAQKRLAYARHPDVDNWGSIWASDEASIGLDPNTRGWVWRRPGKAFKPNKVAGKGRINETVMLWAMMMADGRVIWRFFDEYYLNGRSATAAAYCLLLHDVLIEFYEPGQAFLQDNARIHTAKLSKEFFESHGVWVVKYPPYSPDLNPIEHLWAALKAKLTELYPNLYSIPGNRETKRKVIKEAIKTTFNTMLGEAQ